MVLGTKTRWIVRSGVVLPTWLDHNAVRSVMDDFPSDVHWTLLVRVAEGAGVDAVELSTAGPVAVQTVQSSLARLGCADRLLQRSLAMIPPARCQLGISVRWSASGPLLVAVRFGRLQEQLSFCSNRVSLTPQCKCEFPVFFLRLDFVNCSTSDF